MTANWPQGAALEAALDHLLLQVEKPTRYLGGEWNSIDPAARQADVSMVLAFPDVYEIGMSHLGFRILYGLLNSAPGVTAERSFMPWVDMLRLLRERNLPLTTLESRRPLRDFDLVGFSMQYELTITNVLAMLEQGGIPLLAEGRGDATPLVIGGGPVLVNPEPFAGIFDLILAGDAEEALPELIERYRELRSSGTGREEMIEQLGTIPGWYAPQCYQVEPEPLLGMLIPRPKPDRSVPDRVRRRLIYDLDRFPFPEDIVVPHGDIVHDRVSWEIQRGCPVGCRFCQAGYIYRPTRERKPDAVREGVRRSIESTGYDEFSLTSLNTGEYGAIEPLLTNLMDEMEPRSVSVGLSSLHASTMTENLAAQVRRVRKTGFTIAPEAGSQRLRDVINKNLSEEQILTATRLAFEAGWQAIKLYFMIGLPTETSEDVDAQVDLARRILEQGRGIGSRRVRVTLSASTFVPKVFTPFQWFGMQAEDEFLDKQKQIRRRVPRGVEFRHHNHGESWLEGVLSRADRSVTPAILAAYRNGAVLDGWSEHFKPEIWREAFASAGVPADELATRAIPLEAELPWEVIDPLIRRKWLEREYQRSLEMATVVPCSSTSCGGCAPFARECVKGIIAKNRWTELEPLPAAAGLPRLETAPPPVPRDEDDAVPQEELPERPVYRYRVRFSKLGRARFLGHLDLVRALLHGLRRAGVQMAYSRGFKPRPRISLGPALALGISSREEYLDVETHTPLDGSDWLARINGKLSEGLRFSAIVPLAAASRSLQDEIGRASYRAKVPGIEESSLQQLAEAFASRSSVIVERLRKGRRRQIDLRPQVERIATGGDSALVFDILTSSGGTPRPVEVLEALLGRPPAPEVELERVGLFSTVAGRETSPLVAARVGRARSA